MNLRPLFLAALAFVASPALAEEATVHDSSRIVSIGGPVTEILYALGAQDRIVGRDSTSTYPPQANALPDVGYMRALSAEGVLSLSPTLILAVEGSGPPDVIHLLEGASVDFVTIPDGPDPKGVAAKIRAVAEAIGEKQRGEEIATAVEADFAALEASLGGIQARPKAAFVLTMSGGAPLVGGAGTSADGALALAHADNVFSGLSGFKPATPESVLAAAPEVIVTMQSPVHRPETIAQSPIFASTPAGRNGNIVAMDGTYLLGFGPRAAHAMRDLAAALHPEADLPRLPARPWVGAGAP
ncbi:ABC transporter substrate-binding protein [Aureimonas sp. OT7]|uniref:heme/hemin ABC transporter substrate-binding protein n=1 Tax=Aureimonas TaxID=414371 RepID=UPI00177D0D6F|nr:MULTISPECIES: ABC transporter substrate-binding protein [Aureimonas]QOG07177.1 ABC transporter substrate-binding protein [Aureimonas sp. OT7]